MKTLTLLLPRMNMPVGHLALALLGRAHDQHVQEIVQHFASRLALHIERTTVTRTLTGKKQLMLELSWAVDLKALLRAGSHAFVQGMIDGLLYQDEDRCITVRMRGMWRRTWF